MAAELVVECDRGGECCEACGEADAEVLQVRAPWRSGEDVLAGPEDALDALAYRREVRPLPGSSLRRGRMILASRLASWASKSLPRKFLSPIRISVWPGWRSQRSTSCRHTSFSSIFGEVSASARGVPSKAQRACSLNPQKWRLWLAQYPYSAALESASPRLECPPRLTVSRLRAHSTGVESTSSRSRPARRVPVVAYLMKSISEYFGSGQRSSATSFSSRSATSRTSSIAGITVSRM